MRKVVLSLSLIMLLLMFIGIGHAKIDPNSIAAYWKFNEGVGGTAYDSSKNENHGRIINAEWVEGIEGKALSFPDGAFVEVPNSKSLDITEELTVSAWIKVIHQGLQVIIGKDDDTSERSWHFGITDEGGAPPGKLRFTTFPGHITTLGGKNGTVATDSWTFVAATFDGKKIKLYSDCALDGMGKTDEGPLTSIEEPVKIGVMDETNGGHWWFRGAIDEVAIFNKALNKADLKKIMENGLEDVLSDAMPAPPTFGSIHRLSTTWGDIKHRY